MKIKWLGHACFLITSDEKIRIITDPYVPGHLGINYGKIEEDGDIVVVSHNHEGHNNVAAVKGSPAVVKGIGSQKVRGLNSKGWSPFTILLRADSGGLIRYSASPSMV